MNNDLDILNDKYMYIQTIEFFVDLIRNRKIPNQNMMRQCFSAVPFHFNAFKVATPELIYLVYEFFKMPPKVFNFLALTKQAVRINKETGGVDIGLLDDGGNRPIAIASNLGLIPKESMPSSRYTSSRMIPYMLEKFIPKKDLEEFEKKLLNMSPAGLKQLFRNNERELFLNQLIIPNISFSELFNFNKKFWWQIARFCYSSGFAEDTSYISLEHMCSKPNEHIPFVLSNLWQHWKDSMIV